MPRGHYVRTKFRSIDERLLAKTVKTSTCWLWTGAKGVMGHGQIQSDRNESPTRRLLMTHRVSWELHNGPIPEGLCVLHKCDVPNCIRPSHLFLGTKAQNSADMTAKARQKRGRDLPQAKLTERQVRAIRKSDATQKALASKYGVSQSLISNIKTGKYWKHL